MRIKLCARVEGLDRAPQQLELLKAHLPRWPWCDDDTPAEVIPCSSKGRSPEMKGDAFPPVTPGRCRDFADAPVVQLLFTQLEVVEEGSERYVVINGVELRTEQYRQRDVTDDAFVSLDERSLERGDHLAAV